MSYDFKKIADLELVNEVPEGANVLIETEGATKRLSSTAINNGYSKDEVYNKTEADNKFLTKETIAKPDWNQNDENAADYIKNRTHWEDEDGTVHKLDKKYLPDVGGLDSNFVIVIDVANYTGVIAPDRAFEKLDKFLRNEELINVSLYLYLDYNGSGKPSQIVCPIDRIRYFNEDATAIIVESGAMGAGAIFDINGETEYYYD